MSKYIRTENNIYLIHKDISYGGNKIYKIYNHDFSIIGNDFKVADTIEELCDEFVIHSKDDDVHYIMNWFDFYEDLQEDRFRSTDIIYGAIWADKGLIYVAKVNKENRELELL